MRSRPSSAVPSAQPVDLARESVRRRRPRSPRESYPQGSGHIVVGDDTGEVECYSGKSSTPPPTTGRQPAGSGYAHDAVVVRSLCGQLRQLGFVGARPWLRSLPDLVVVVEAIAEVKAAIAAGQRVASPPALLRWLVGEELRAQARVDAHLAAGTPRELVPWRSPSRQVERHVGDRLASLS